MKITLFNEIMRNRLPIPLLLLLWMTAISCQQKSPQKNPSKTRYPDTDSLKTKLLHIQQQEELPGFAVSIFTQDEVLFQEGFGYANIAKKEPYSIHHVQMIASVTKTLVGVSLMKAVEDQLISLDDPINHILPFPVYNPHHPDIPITIRHLATHTSSIGTSDGSDKGYRFKEILQASDFPKAYEALLPHYNQQGDYTLATFLERKLHRTGEWYSQDTFIQSAPGTSYEYSNLGIALLAHIIELKTKQSFDSYTKQLLLTPFQMKSSSWNLNTLSDRPVITYYNELKKPLPAYSIITYPDGGLYSSVADMTLFLQQMMKGYQGNCNLMKASSFRTMMSKQLEGENMTEGLCWDLSFSGLIGHAGNDFGTTTLMYFSPETGIGRILFTNITVETEAQEEAFYGIYNLLFQYDWKP